MSRQTALDAHPKSRGKLEFPQKIFTAHVKSRLIFAFNFCDHTMESEMVVPVRNGKERT